MRREDAVRALKLGFRRDTLLSLQDKHGDFTCDFIYVIRDSDAGDVHFYATSTPRDVEKALRIGAGALDKEVVAYADGSGTQFNKPAGIGVAVMRPWADMQMIAENIGLGSNNRAELCAIWRALRAVPHVEQRLVIRTDSEYAIGSLTKDWVPQKNAGLIANIRFDLGSRHNVRFEHVPGHAGVDGNEIADLLSKMGRKWIRKETLFEGD